MLFEESEYVARLDRTKARMAAAGIDVLLLSNPANQFWVSGYDGWSFYTPQIVVVALEHDQPVWIGRGQDVPGARLTAYVKENNIVGYPDDYVASAERHPLQFVSDFLHGKGWHTGRIGVEMDDYYYSARWHSILTSSLPNAQFVDSFLLVNWLRMVKSPQELDFMRQAARIAEKAMSAFVEAIEPGVRQCDAMAEIYRWTTAGTPEFGGAYTCKPPNVGTGPAATAPHLSWTDEPYREDEATNMELGGCRNRYHTPLARTIYLGDAPQLMRDTAEVVVEGLSAALEAARPGATCEEVESAWKSVVSRHGIEKNARIGYPVGIGYPPTWGELTASIRPGDQTVLEENMTFHCIPGIWRTEGWGVVISEAFRVGQDGAHPFCNFPRKLIVKDRSAISPAACLPNRGAAERASREP
jgi:ectoine hydrolase